MVHFPRNKFKIAHEFLSKHKWPVILSDERYNRCYCESCHSKDLPDTCIIGGRTYVAPLGYTRIGVHIDERFAEHHKIFDTWNNCYHGTSIKKAMSIIENGGPLLPGDEAMDGVEIKIRPGHIPGEGYFFTTPTIKYASLPQYASSYDFKSPSDGKTYEIKVVLQLKQKPNSFIIQRETVGRRLTRICPYIKNEEIEWKTKKRNTTVTYGILLGINDVGKDVDTRVKTKFSLMRPTRLMEEAKHDYLMAHLSDWEQVECPHCLHMNDWVNPTENQGIVLTCESIACQAKLKPLKCPQCQCISTYCDCYSRFNNERFFECENSKCGKQLLSRQCPHCSVGFNYCSEPRDNQRVSVKCPEIRCKKTYHVFMCPHCRYLKNSKTVVGKEGLIVTCDDKKCLKKYQLAECPKCLNVNVCGNVGPKAGTDGTVKCAYKGCNEKFRQPLKTLKSALGGK